MSLSNYQIEAEWERITNMVYVNEDLQTFARAIEAKVRKQDDSLILQLVEALDDLVEAGEEAWSEERPCVRIGKEAATAGRARLEGKP